MGKDIRTTHILSVQMLHPFISLACVLVCIVFSRNSALAQVPAPSAKPPAVTFEKQIRPLIVSQCVGCHNRTTLSNVALSGGLALDSYEATLKGVVAGGKPARSILVKGNPDESEIVKRLETLDTSRRMPKGGDPLPKDKIALVRTWISSGTARGIPGKNIADPSTPPPAPPGPVLDVTFPTVLAAPAGLAAPTAPKDAKLGITLAIGPLPPITALAYSPDGHLLAVGGYRTVFLWDLTVGKVERALSDFSGPVQAMIWTGDGSKLIVAGGAPGATGEAKVLDVKADYRVIQQFIGHTDVIYSASLSPDGSKLATASHDKTARIWELATGKSLVTIKSHSDVVYSVRFMPDGKSLISCGQDKSVRQFNVADGTPVRTFDGHGQAVLALAVRSDGKFIVTAGNEPRLRWWDTSNGNTARYSDGCSQQVNDIVFSKDGKLLAAASADHSIRIWDGDNGGSQKTFSDSPDWNYRVAISPDGKFVAGAGADGIVRIWEIAANALRASIVASVTGGTKQSSVESAIVTPQGYFQTTAKWNKRTALSVAGARVPAGADETLAVLRNEASSLKLLHGEKVEPPVLPAAPAAKKPDPAKPAIGK